MGFRSMGLRAKLAVWFWALLICAILATSVVSLDRALKVMARGLIDSGNLTVDEIFEQIRDALMAGGKDPAAALSADRGLRTAVESAHAFGKSVVYVKVVGSDGRVIVAAPPDAPPSSASPAEIELLEHDAASIVPLRLLPALWSEQTYEASAPIDLAGHPFGIIRVGLSTGLIAADVHGLVLSMTGIGIAAMVLSTMVVLVLGNRMLRPVQALTTSVQRLAEDGSEITVELSGHDELSTLADRFNQLSKRVRSERAQWETERGRMVDAFRSITDAVILIDASGSILFSNPEVQDRLGLGANSEGKQLGMLLGANHPLMQLVAPALAVGTEVHDVALELADNGLPPAHYLVSIFSLGQGKSPVGLLIMLRGLEQMNELEAVVDYSSRLARLGGLLSGVAHQLRGPLGTMTAQLQMLRQEADAGKPLENRIERLRREIARLDQAIGGLMRFMRPQELKTEEIVLNDLLTQAGAAGANPKVKVEYHLNDDTGRIFGDRALLSEALRNIIQNGVQAMPEGGMLKLSSSCAEPEWVEIEVADQGLGIAEAARERIFELYFTTKESGTGLGLPLALRAIDLHRGTIDVESIPGAGTTFKIRLPRSAGNLTSSSTAGAA